MTTNNMFQDNISEQVFTDLTRFDEKDCSLNSCVSPHVSNKSTEQHAKKSNIWSLQ